ncbi:hypothetical protein [Alkalihalobacillus sp. TS-13]|uniref:hypothetical protein n=1 Tax=Alkalihalobacillus sp. TS-13 TaxID=2842455 RepID=UPI001C87BB95|nr:hypothetical protein [Alkalihalobacillus sp. TS-13]
MENHTTELYLMNVTIGKKGDLMEINFLIVMGLIVFVIFIVSIFFMVGDRISMAGKGQQEELMQLRKKVEELEKKMDEN